MNDVIKKKDEHFLLLFEKNNFELFNDRFISHSLNYSYVFK